MSGTVESGYRVTREWVALHRTPAGGWTVHQLSQLGVAWPPQRGWKDRVAGLHITLEQKLEFERCGAGTLASQA